MNDIPVPPPADRRVLIGKIVKIRGLRGDLKIVPLTWNIERFEQLENVWCQTKDGRVHLLTVKRVRFEPSALYMRFKEAALREFAEPLVNGELFIDVEQRAELPGDMYYHDDVLGMQVTCINLGLLGEVKEVMDLPANDVWRLEGPKGEILLPVIKDVVLDINYEEKTVKVELPEGLIEEPKEKIKDPRRLNKRRRKKVDSEEFEARDQQESKNDSNAERKSEDDG